MKPDSELLRLADAYLRQPGRHFSPQYRQTFRCNCRRFERFAGCHPVDEITAEHMTLFREKCSNEGMKPETITKSLVDVRIVIRWKHGIELHSEENRPMPRKKAVPDSELTQAAEDYSKTVQPKNGRMLRSHARRFEVLVGRVPIAEISGEHMERYRQLAIEKGFSATTIEKLVNDVRSVVAWKTGTIPGPGRPPAPQRAFPVTPLMQSMKQYMQECGITQGPAYHNARRFSRVLQEKFGDLQIQQLTKEHFVEFRKLCLEKGLSHTTIEKTITDIGTCYRYLCDAPPNVGRRLRRRRPRPNPVPMETLERIWPYCPQWLRQWLALTVWTGARLSDGMRMQKSLHDGGLSDGEFIRFEASKTGRVHLWPIPSWLKQWLKPVELPFGRINQHSARVHRAVLTAVCDKAGVPIFTPKQLRQRAISQWARADGAAGALIHGKTLGVLDHYVCHEDILNAAMPRVVMPDVFKGDVKESSQAISVADLDPAKLFSQLDENTKRVMVQTMLAMLGVGKQ
ncbi:MAG: hypothetical protein JNL58_31460 [Planctomyces sp.]|nr:hypothetical protein [Planctomyces sp.]